MAQPILVVRFSVRYSHRRRERYPLVETSSTSLVAAYIVPSAVSPPSRTPTLNSTSDFCCRRLALSCFLPPRFSPFACPQGRKYRVAARARPPSIPTFQVHVNRTFTALNIPFFTWGFALHRGTMFPQLFRFCFPPNRPVPVFRDTSASRSRYVIWFRARSHVRHAWFSSRARPAGKSLRHVSLREMGWSREPYEFRSLASGIKG